MSQQSEVRDAPIGLVRQFPLLPGIVLATTIAAACLTFRSLSGISSLSPMILAIVVGIAVQNLWGAPASALPGIAFSAKRLLRLGIVLLGLQLTLTQVLSLGGGAVAILAATLLATFFAIRLAGRALGVDRALTDLIAAGTAVCGASAVVAANTVSRGSDEDVAYAIACVSILGSISMFVYPLLAQPLGLDDVGFGLWVGATVHEVAQVAAAAFQHSDAAGQYGTVSKLTRVVMLAPLVLGMAVFATSRGEGEARAETPVPWFVLGFVCMVIVNSAVELPAIVAENVGLVTNFLLASALAAIGLQINAGRLRAKGAKPLLLGVFGWLFIAVFGLAALKLFGY
ncbi:YeiH family protein [Arvimicrobium flavum]|uniref:YeiH family protein n=1 Tax=Arvimicrobium flavum TaxID=3393320 RepID=UPI00237C460C|nr:putative sulfate exporter family transporter [Mesorhizobium shangrilense]